MLPLLRRVAGELAERVAGEVVVKSVLRASRPAAAGGRDPSVPTAGFVEAMALLDDARAVVEGWRAQYLATRERILARLPSTRHDDAVLERLLQRLGPGQNGDRPPLAWITASNGRETQLIMLEDVVYFRADNKYTTVITAAGESLLRTPLRELLEVLDPQHFRQIHRSTIVNMKSVAAVSRDDTGRGVLRLRQRPETLVVSQPFMSLFRGM
jgi:DNA-binding LytR/AlgR family response regulator